MKVEYAQLPYSCSICKAFGHSLARCVHNPNRKMPKARTQGSVNQQQKNEGRGKQGEGVPVNEEQVKIFFLNRGMVPYVTGNFVGCDVTMDEDVILAQCENANLENDDSLEDYDVEAPTEIVDEVEPQNSVIEPQDSVIEPQVSVQPGDGYLTPGRLLVIKRTA